MRLGGIALAAVGLAGCGNSATPPDPGPLAGTELANGIVFATEAAHAQSAPYRCAELTATEQHVRKLAPADGGLRVAFVADARGATEATLARTRELAGQLGADHTQLIVSLGGLGTSREEIAAVLGALAGSKIPIVAVPGEREAVPAHRAAIAELAGRGIDIADGSIIRLIVAGDIAIATLPGAAATEQLVAGTEGCLRTADDAAVLARELAGTNAAVKVWASHAPQREDGADASDVGRSGVHIGEIDLVAPVHDSGARLVVHATVDEAVFGPDSGEAAHASIGTGPLEMVPVRDRDHSSPGGAALLVHIAAGQLRWRRLVAGARPTP